MPPDRLRILQVAPWSVHGSGTGGMAAVVRDLSAALRDAGHHVEILTNAWNAPGPVRDGAEVRLRLPGPPAEAGGWRRLKWPIHRERAARALVSLCRRERVDIIHAHFASPYLATLARARALGGPPYLVTCHRGDVLAMPQLDVHQRTAVITGMHTASACVAVSRWLAGEAETAFGLDHVETVPNGFQPPWTEVPFRAQVEASLGRRLPKRYAVMVANMRPYKGHPVALDAWRIVQKSADLPLVLVGDGPDFGATRTLAQRKGLDDRVVFLGHLDRETAVGVMAYAQMVIGPSQNEGQGLFALEAGALSRPLVCSAIPPLLDIVDHGQSALTFQPGDAEALAKAVLQLAGDLGLQERLGSRLNAVVHRDFSIGRMAGRYYSVYDKVRENHGRGDKPSIQSFLSPLRVRDRFRRM